MRKEPIGITLISSARQAKRGIIKDTINKYYYSIIQDITDCASNGRTEFIITSDNEKYEKLFDPSYLVHIISPLNNRLLKEYISMVKENTPHSYSFKVECITDNIYSMNEKDTEIFNNTLTRYHSLLKEYIKNDDKVMISIDNALSVFPKIWDTSYKYRYSLVIELSILLSESKAILDIVDMPNGRKGIYLYLDDN